MTNSELCRRSDCCYWNRAYNDPVRCSYMEITGKSRIKGLPPRLQLPCNCPYYLPNGDPSKAEEGPDEKQTAYKLYLAGATDREIDAALGWKRGRACSWRRRNSLPVNPEGRDGKKPVYDWDAARRAYDEGASDGEIMALLGCTRGTVYYWRQKNGLPLHPEWERKRELKRKERGEDKHEDQSAGGPLQQEEDDRDL